jgi:hypothetical protein
MERQRELGLRSREERQEWIRRFLEPLEFTDRMRCVVELLFLDGHETTRGKHQVFELAISTRRAAKRVAVTKSSFVRGVEDLERSGLLWVVRKDSPRVYILNWTRLEQVEPPPPNSSAPLESLAFFNEDLPPPGGASGPGCPRPVQAGPGRSRPVQPARASVKSANIKNPCFGEAERSEALGEHGARLDQVDQVDRPAWWKKPWSLAEGVRDAVLLDLVRQTDVDGLMHLYREAVQVFRHADCEENLLRFFTAVHHVATSRGLTQSRMGNLVRRMIRGQQRDGLIDVDMIRQRSEEWARRILAAKFRDPLLAERMCDEPKPEW